MRKLIYIGIIILYNSCTSTETKNDNQYGLGDEAPRLSTYDEVRADELMQKENELLRRENELLKQEKELESIKNATTQVTANKIFEGLEEVKVLYSQEIYDAEIQSNISTIKINEDFINSSNNGIRAILGFYALSAGSECEWNNDTPNANFSNLRCKLTDALNLGFQCSTNIQSFLKKWFANEKEYLNLIDNCYNIPNTATSQKSYEYINLIKKGDNVLVNYKVVGVNLSTQSSWKVTGTDRYLIDGNKIKVISQVTDN